MKFNVRLGLILAALLAICSCAKLMEDQPPADSLQALKDTIDSDTLAKSLATKVPERFQQFFYREFTGTVSTSSGRVHMLTVETVMDVIMELKSEAPGIVFTLKKDGLDITEEPVSSWQGRLVPGRYMIAILPSQQASLTRATPYAIVIREE